MNAQRFVIYNASAGSGKTFKIATKYLNHLFQAQSKQAVYRLIGITFTNKAAEEMKKRVIDNLIEAAKGNLTDVMAEVAKESKSVIKKQTGITDDKLYQQELIKRSRQRLTEILHYYDEFQLTTIDKLMYKIIKTFAREMHLSSDVEVTMDYTEVVDNLIDYLINTAEKGSLLSKFLINFSLDKIDDDKSWDIKQDLSAINKIIFNDNYFESLKSLEGKNLADFVALYTFLSDEIRQIELQFTKFGKALDAAIQPYNHIFHIKTLAVTLQYNKQKINITNTVRKAFDGEGAYHIKSQLKNFAEIDVELINSQIYPILIEAIPFIDTNLPTYQFLLALKKEINALSIENELQKLIADYKETNNTIFISDFNKLILEQILKDLASDTPYIYMRLGEKYAHYFVDEFQDTSELQWQNLIPLIREALSKEFASGMKGDAMLVGDAKQSIYRFRGGKPEQFIALSQPENRTGEGNPFAPLVDKSVYNLEYNWRSTANIIKFNNQFFSYFPHYLESPYKEVYEQVAQKIPKGKEVDEGFVQIRFLPKKDAKKGIEKGLFTEAIFEAIQKAEQAGYQKSDICVLINKGTEGVKVAEYLNAQGMAVVSSETLLVKNAQKVQFILSWFQFLNNGSASYLYDVIHYIAETKQIIGTAKTDLYQALLGEKNAGKQQLVKAFEKLGYQLDYPLMINLSLYDLAVYLIDVFGLNETSAEQAYLQAFMEKLYQWQSKAVLGLHDFLSDWESIADRFSITAPSQADAVTIMTVHKAKGLEFPVVIYYANVNLLPDTNKAPKVWIPVDSQKFKGFEQLPINLYALEDHPNPDYQSLYKQGILESKFDNLNRLYVAMTRPVEQLYIIMDQPSSKSDKIGFNQIFTAFLNKEFPEFKGDIFEFGMYNKAHKHVVKASNNLTLPKLNYNYWQNQQKEAFLKINNLSYERWSEDKKNAIKYGMTVHDILSKITTKEHWIQIQDKYLKALPEEAQKSIASLVMQVLNHPELDQFYTNDFTILNERSLLIPDKNNFSQKIPDRLLIKDQKAVIIDYKTGAKLSKHSKQLKTYADLLEQMGYQVTKKLLVYLDDETVHVETVA